MRGDRSWGKGPDRQDTPAPVARLMDSTAGGARAEDRLGNLFRQALPPSGLDARAHDRIMRRLRSAAPARRPGRFVLRWALPAVILFSSGAVVASMGVTTEFVRWLSNAVMPRSADKASAPRGPLAARPAEPVAARPETQRAANPTSNAQTPRELAAPSPAAAPTIDVRESVPARPSASPGSRSARGTVARQPSRTLARVDRPAPANTAAHTLAPPAETLPSPGETASVRSLLRSGPSSSGAAPSSTPPELAPPPVAPSSPSALSLETSLLKRAVLSLRRGSPAQALVDLDGYMVRFPSGVLRREARVARVDALLALGDEAEALVDLEQLSFGSHGRDLELRTIRGELHAKRSCTDAIADFSAVLDASPPDVLAERALRGRLGCRLRIEDEDAFEDLESYVRRFPKGRFAREARGLLDRARR